MVRRFLFCLPLLFACMSVPVRGTDLSTQTPRQAVIEMFSGGEEKFRQHLTVEVQEKIRELLKSSAANGMTALETLTAGSTGQKFDSFDSGRILFAFNNAQQHHRLEIHIDADDWRDKEDTMDLSVHSFRDGVEEEVPVHLRFQLGLKLQESVWRLNSLTLSVNLPVGDPRILEKSWWVPQMLAGSTAAGQKTSVETEKPTLTPMRAVHRITLAENLYAQRHPEIGFTCALPNLVNVGKGIDEAGPYQFLGPEFSGGVYNGYKYAIKSCEGKPARTFQVIAEPVNGKGKAYCADERHVVRSSDDGRAATCLASGRTARQ